MGKAGEKQKRRPKIKDKKQSERFKEAARELGADQESELALRILEQMVSNRMGPGTIPRTARLVGINSGGLARLDDESTWRIAAGDLSRAQSWVQGDQIALSDNDPGTGWRYRLTHIATGVAVGGLPSP